MKKSTLFAIAASTIAVISLTTYGSLTHAHHMDASSHSEKVLKHVASKSTSSMVKASKKAKTESSDQKQESHDQDVVASNAAQTTSDQTAETQVSDDTSVSTTTAPAAEPEQQATQPSAVAPAPAPAPARTDGMNFKGNHFDLQPFSGVNGEKTPSWTPYIFKWTALPNYYLAEQASAAGPATMSLSIGDEIVLDGRVLHVTQVVPGMVRMQSMNLVAQLSGQHAIGIQTCENATGSIVRTVWAD